MKDKKSILAFYVPMIAILSFILFPFLWMLITSLKDSSEMFEMVLYYLPQNPTLKNYYELFEHTTFIHSTFNSLLVSTTTAFINIVVATMAGYAFSRFEFKGRNLLLQSILLIYMLPQVLFLTPLFTTMKSLGLINTYFSLIISYCTFTVPFSVWLMVGFMNKLPIELEEAARIDGCSKLRAFFKVVLPILRPGIAATATYIFINAWNEYLYGVMFTNESTRTVTVEIASYIGQYGIRWDHLTAGGVMAALPVITLFMLVQKNFISGLTAGSVKG